MYLTMVDVPGRRPHTEEGSTVMTSFTVEDGVVTWELMTSADQLSTLDDAFDEHGIKYQIEYVRAVDANHTTIYL